MWSGWDRNESATESYCRSSTRRQCLMAIFSGSIAGNMFWKVLQADELQWLVIVREVVENDNGRVVVGRLHGRGEGIERSCRRPWRKSSGGRESVCIPPPGRHQEKKAIRGSEASVTPYGPAILI